MDSCWIEMGQRESKIVRFGERRPDTILIFGGFLRVALANKSGPILNHKSGGKNITVDPARGTNMDQIVRYQPADDSPFDKNSVPVQLTGDISGSAHPDGTACHNGLDDLGVVQFMVLQRDVRMTLPAEDRFSRGNDILFH